MRGPTGEQEVVGVGSYGKRGVPGEGEHSQAAAWTRDEGGAGLASTCHPCR